MAEINFDNAYYIKLGRGGEWERSSIEERKIRIGWKEQSLDDINNGRWDIIKKQIEEQIQDRGAATRDFQALKNIVESTEDDIWITFYMSKLWWCKPGEKTIYEDHISKYRKVKECWRDTDINGEPLLINAIPGYLAQIQGFRATVCKVRYNNELRRLLNSQPSSEYKAISDAKIILVQKIENAIRQLHWKDFEILVDLIFRNSGWQRLTFIGKSQKYVDIELKEPITGELYQVQVKSRANLIDFIDYANQFSGTYYRKLYFIVHSPEEDLINYQRSSDNKNIELLLPQRLAEMVVDSGLLTWLMNKIK